MTKKLRVFIVDDSTLARVALHQVIQKDATIEVAGEARSGMEALRRIPLAQPDLVIMDMVMPGMDGLAATREIMARYPRPILVVSDLVGRDAQLNFEALKSGALDLVRKPSAEDLGNPAAVDAFLRKLHILAGVPVITRRWHRRPGETASEPSPLRSEGPRNGRVQLVVVGASTGGPIALHQIFSALGGPLDCPVLIVQHMTSGFTQGMVQWLGEALGVPVRLARDGVEPRAGTIYVAPEGGHLIFCGHEMRLTRTGPPRPHCPAVDALFESVAATEMAKDTLAVLLTGMGKDGAQGMLALREAGAWTIAQDEATSVVYGMPRAAALLGAVSEQLPLERIPERLLEACGSYARTA